MKVQCIGKTKIGGQCKNRTDHNSKLCRVHRDNIIVNPGTLDIECKFHLSEYNKLRDEAQQRVVLQNNNVHYSLFLSAIILGFLGTLYQATVKVDDPSSLDTFTWIGVFTGFVYAILIELLIGNWIYQLSMAFRIGIYNTWKKNNVLKKYIPNKEGLFRWDDTVKSDPWHKILGKNGFIGLLQVGFLYGLVTFVSTCLVFVAVKDLINSNYYRLIITCVSIFLILCLLYFLARVHKNLHTDYFESMKDAKAGNKP